MTNSDPILVLGGTGKTGRRVAQRLRALGRPVRIGSRAGHSPFGWIDRATWPASLAGAHAGYLTYQPDLAFPGAADAVAEYPDGRNVATTGGVADALGRPPRDFTQFAATAWGRR